MKKLVLVITLIFVTACAQNKNIYYWGDYSNTLYATKKEPSQRNEERHYRELIKIISSADNHNKRVPPGIFFELGMYESKKGNHDKANQLFSQEHSLYPEAKTYIDKVKEGDKDE